MKKIISFILIFLFLSLSLFANESVILQLRNALERSNATIGLLVERVQTLESQRDTLIEQVEILTNRTKVDQTEIEELREHIRTLNEQIINDLQAIGQLRSELLYLTDRFSQVIDNNEEMKEALNETIIEINKYQVEISGLRNSLNITTDKLEEIERNNRFHRFINYGLTIALLLILIFKN